MPRSDEAATFFTAVYSAVQEIPPGKVTSYGHIAKLIGTRKRNILIQLTRCQGTLLWLKRAPWSEGRCFRQTPTWRGRCAAVRSVFW